MLWSGGELGESREAPDTSRNAARFPFSRRAFSPMEGSQRQAGSERVPRSPAGSSPGRPSLRDYRSRRGARPPWKPARGRSFPLFSRRFTADVSTASRVRDRGMSGGQSEGLPRLSTEAGSRPCRSPVLPDFSTSRRTGSALIGAREFTAPDHRSTALQPVLHRRSRGLCTSLSGGLQSRAGHGVRAMVRRNEQGPRRANSRRGPCHDSTAPGAQPRPISCSMKR